MTNKVFPLQQGQLDWLCSVYAAINTMHIFGKISTPDEAAAPFRRAMSFLKMPEAICEGIDEEDCCELFQKLTKADWEVDSDRSGQDRLSRLEQLLHEGAKAVIVALVRDTKGKRDVMHYTVVTKVSSKSLTISDSQGKAKIEVNGGELQYDGTAIKLGDFFVMTDE